MDKQFKVERGILVFAMRYALGRQTFAPTIVMDNIRHNINLLSKENILMLIKDIDEQKDFGGYGMECDEKNWMYFKQFLIDIVAERDELNKNEK